MIRRARASIQLEAAQAEVFELLTSYDDFADWLPGIVSCRVLAREGDISVVELVIDDRFLTLELIASPPHEVQFATVDEPRRRSVSGGWRCHEDSSGKGLVLEARLRMHARLFDFRARHRMHDALETALAALRQRVARVTRQFSTTGVARRKILEVNRHSEGIRVWIEGNTYELSSSNEEVDS